MLIQLKLKRCEIDLQKIVELDNKFKQEWTLCIIFDKYAASAQTIKHSAPSA